MSGPGGKPALTGKRAEVWFRPFTKPGSKGPSKRGQAMRRALLVGVLTLAVGSLGLGGLGQRGEAQSGFLGASPKSIQFQPVNTSKNVSAINTQNMLHTPKPPSPLGL